MNAYLNLRLREAAVKKYSDMESRDHDKNGAGPKSHTIRINQLVSIKGVDVKLF